MKCVRRINHQSLNFREFIADSINWHHTNNDIDQVYEGGIKWPPLASTFELSTRDELLSLKKGDIVKLVFDAISIGGERMWVVIVDQRSNQEWYGILDNYPIVIDAISFGARIKFHPYDVIDIWHDEPSVNE